MRPLLIMIALAACAHNPGMPHYRNSWPALLTPVGPARDPATVKVVMTTLPWWSVADSTHFVLRFDEQPSPPIAGNVVGDVRSGDFDLTDEQVAAIRCAWSDSDACNGMPIAQAGALAHEVVTTARDDLRAHGGELGAAVVGQARCFVEQRESVGLRARLWCEGVAINAEAPASVEDHDVAAPRQSEIPLPESRFALVADGSVGAAGTQLIVGSTIGVRYRPFEAGFYILDLARKTVAPQDNGVMGLGLTLLGRKQLGHSRADAIVGGSALAVVKNGAVNQNPFLGGMYQGFVGLAYQSRLDISHGQPWVQLRVGSSYAQELSPLVELHLGLSTRERR